MIREMENEENEEDEENVEDVEDYKDDEALLSHIRFETRMILLCGFLNFCRVHEYTNQGLSSRKSFPRRFLKKMKNSTFLASFCID